MASRTLEAKLVISGEDRASQVIDKITRATKQFARDSDMSAAMRKNAEAAAKAEQAYNAVQRAMAGRDGFAKAQADAKAAQAAAIAYAKSLDDARKACAAFEGVKAAKGSDQAQQMEAAAKAVRDASAAYRKAEGDVRRTSAAVTAQSSALGHAEAAAKALGADLGSLEAHEQRLRASVDAATSAINRQIAAEERATRVGSAMSGLGRAQLDRIETSRRLTDGMSAQARATQRLQEEEVRLGQAEQHRVRIKAAEDRVERRQARADAYRGAAGIIGLGAVHKAEHFAGHALHMYQHFDNERRFGKVVMNLSDEQQKPLVDQAIHMGAISRYNDVKVLHAQRELAARGLNRDQVLGMIPHVKDLGQALDIDIGAAAKQVEAGIFAFKKDISTLDAATKSAKQTADVQVAAAKISGMTPEDIQQAYKYGATPARLAHVSEERMLAFAGVLKKATIGGDEAGVAFRALMSMTNAPTAGAKVAMRAAGLDYNNYQKKPDKLAVDPFVKQVAESYGVKLDGTVQAGLRKIFSNKGLIGDSTKFTPAVMELLGDNLGGDDAKSKKSIAGLANRYRNASMQGVDANRLIDDLLVKLKDNLAFANALFGSKQGGRIATALSDAETFTKMQKLLAEHSEGRAAQVSDARMAGFDGAVLRFQGAVTNLETKLGRAWDNDGKGGALTDVTSKAGQFIQHLAELDNRVVQAGTVAAGIGTVLVGLKSIGLLQSGFGLRPAAVELTTAAKMLQGSAVGKDLGTGGGADSKKGGKLKGAVKAGVGVAGAFGLEPLAQLAQAQGIFEMPDLARDGWLRSGLNLLDPNFGNGLLGDRSKAIPSMAIRLGEAPFTINWGSAAFGLSGALDPFGQQAALGARSHPKMIDAEAAEREGKEAGTKAGEGIRSGIETKAPEVQQEGASIMQRLQQLFSAGIFVPIHLQVDGGAGGGGSGVQSASFGGGGGGSGPGGLIHRASLGGGGGGGGGGGPTGPMPTIPMSVAMTGTERNELGLVTKYEAGGRNVPNYINDRRHTAQGYYQITNTNWRNIAPKLGISASNAMSASLEDQTRVALYLRRQSGLGNWTRYNPRLRGALGRGERVPLATPPEPPPQPSFPSVPDAPPAGLDAGRGGMNAAADKIQAAAEIFKDSGFHGQIQLALSGDGARQARVTGLRTKGRGIVTADMGVSMPGAKESDGDWT